MVAKLKADPDGADLNGQDRAMLDFALKLTTTPALVQQEDFRQLLENGFSEEQAVDVVLITCIFNFMNRLADGLGVYEEPGLARNKPDDS